MVKEPKIILVEDEAMSAFYLGLQLRNMGFPAFATYHSGEEALAKVPSERPDLLLMDINLSGAINGIDAARKIKEGLDVGVIFITGYSDPSIRALAEEVKPVAFLVNPVDLKELRKAILSVVGLKAGDGKPEA